MEPWIKTLHIIRGLPGDGKSTLALQLVNGERARVVENDDFWFVPNPLPFSAANLVVNSKPFTSNVSRVNDLYKNEHEDIQGPYLHYTPEYKVRYEYRYDVEITRRRL